MSDLDDIGEEVALTPTKSKKSAKPAGDLDGRCKPGEQPKLFNWFNPRGKQLSTNSYIHGLPVVMLMSENAGLPIYLEPPPVFLISDWHGIELKCSCNGTFIGSEKTRHFIGGSHRGM